MKGYIAAVCSFIALVALISVSTMSYAQSGPNLINNGTFGLATYQPRGASVFSPSQAGWTLSANGAVGLQLKSQTVEAGCGPRGCYGNNAHNWACVAGSAQVGVETSSIGGLKPNTQYRLSYYAFKNVTGVAPTNANYFKTADVSAYLHSGKRGSYLLKDFSILPLEFTKTSPALMEPITVQFTTPVELNSSGEPNINAATLRFKWNSANAVQMCLTGVNLQEVTSVKATSRVVVNTYGYPMAGNKVATLVLPQGTATAGMKWRLRKNNGWVEGMYEAVVPVYAAVLGLDYLPLKDANNNYTLQTKGGSYVQIASSTTGGRFAYSPENNGALSATGLTLDADSGEHTYTLDFSSYGKKTSETYLPDLTAFPPNVVQRDRTSIAQYGYPMPTATYTYDQCINCYIEVLDANNRLVATSDAFSVLHAPYQNLKNDALFSFYHQRSGVSVIPSFIAPKAYNTENNAQTHIAGHKGDIATCWANGVKNLDLHENDWGNSVADCYNFTKDVTGGWYDAADHGKYVVNGGIALWTMQNLIERLQTKGTLNTAFPAGKLKLPTTFNDQGAAIANLSDLMAEARTEMEWMLKMQVPAGLRMKVPLGYQDKTQTGAVTGPTGVPGVYQVDLTGSPIPNNSAGAVIFGGTSLTGIPAKLPKLRAKLALTSVEVGGLVFHAVHDEKWTGIPLNPETYSSDSKGYVDPKTRIVSANRRVLMYPTSAATLNFAAVAAQCSRIWRGVDNAFANRCFNAAITAWDAAKKFRVGKGTAIPAKSDIFRYEYTNQAWITADPSGRNTAILANGFALNPLFDGGGAYGDLRIGDEFYWAGAELYLASAAMGSPQTEYLTYGKSQGVLTSTDINGQWSKCEDSGEPIQCYSWIYGFDWQNTSALGTLSLLTYQKGKLSDGNAKLNLAKFADKLVTKTNEQGFKFAKLKFDPANRDTQYEWGANGGVLNRAIILGAAYDVATDTAKKQSYADAMVQSMGYLLGRNVMEKSFISGYGKDPLINPHHRWFAKHADVAFPKIPAGYLAGGPNTRDIPALRANAPRYKDQAAVNYAISHGVYDAVIGGINDESQVFFDNNVVKNCVNETDAAGVSYTPQKCYADHYRSFATNEIAINWQAPLVWVTQLLSEIYQ